MQKINCGGFCIDVDTLRLFKDDNGNITLGVLPEVLEGIQGAKGDKGDPFTIAKIYHSVDDMNADHDNQDILIGEFVLIESGMNNGVDDGKLYVKDEVGFDYITNLTGATGLKGDKGDTGVGIPHGGTSGQILFKTNEQDYSTHWGDIPHELPIVDNDDNGKIAKVVDGAWDIGYVEEGQIVYSESNTIVAGYSVPKLTSSQMQTIYNSFVSGKNVIVISQDGNKHYHITSVTPTTATMAYDDKMIVTYGSNGNVSHCTPILKGDVVEYQREFAFSQGDNGYVKEWTPNVYNKQWVECGVFATTTAGVYEVTLPINYSDTNYFVNVNVREQGNWYWYAQPISGNKVSIRVSDSWGTAKAVKISVETRGWANL